jgi:hypothetical protein
MVLKLLVGCKNLQKHLDSGKLKKKLCTMDLFFLEFQVQLFVAMELNTLWAHKYSQES